MILVRYILILLIVYLLVRGFIQSLFLKDEPHRKTEPHDEKPRKRISKNVGDYIDYEEKK